MTYAPKYRTFRFDGYDYDASASTLTFHYSFDGVRTFKETTVFEKAADYDWAAFDRAAFLAFIIAGISYYKCFPTPTLEVNKSNITPEQAEFFTTLYKQGLSQYVYENGLSPDDIGTFHGNVTQRATPSRYEGRGLSVLQSGGKDSLLLAQLLQDRQQDFTAVYMQQSGHYPAVIDTIGVPVRRFRRSIDKSALLAAADDGALNGHVPVTYITLAYALIDAVLNGSNTVAAAIGREGEEPHAYIGEYPVTHQWSKTWPAEQRFAAYVRDFISPDLQVGSPLRGLSELKIAELFVQHAWDRFGRSFSSCNIANYQQGHDNSQLTWCGNCPKCANSYLLFAPFVIQDELNDIFGHDMFRDETLVPTFKGLLGVDDYIKPFECVGEVDELRSAYWLAQANGYSSLPFEVPHSDYDRDALSPMQPWAQRLLA